MACWSLGFEAFRGRTRFAIAPPSIVYAHAVLISALRTALLSSPARSAAPGWSVEFVWIRRMSRVCASGNTFELIAHGP
jgi:hypothetical protein